MSLSSMSKRARVVLVAFSIVLAISISYLWIFPAESFKVSLTSVFSAPKEKRSHLRKLCDSQRWTEGLWLSCHSHCGEGEAICGGLNNARNRLQSCLRLAIDAGAGIVIPKMAVRNANTLRLHDGDQEVCVANYWDTKKLADNLKEDCPQLQMQLCGNTTGLDRKFSSQGTRHYSKASHSIGTFRKLVEADLEKNNITDISASHPVRVDFYDSMFSWNYTASNELRTIRKDLFRQLPYNSDILKLGGNILELANRFRPFVGIHLRGEEDWPSEFGTKEEQMEAFEKDLDALRDSSAAQISNIYVSCGDQKSIQLFRDRMASRDFTVHDKWSLQVDHLDILAEMDRLTFDQKGIVEYTTLTSADYFLGVGLSSMSLLVAFDRTIDDADDYFLSYIHNNSTRAGIMGGFLGRRYPASPIMKGNSKTRLLMLSGPDIMDTYP